MHTDMTEDKKVLLKLRGTFVDMICQIYPENTKNLMYENVQKVLYMLVLCAIYGCIELALQWYKI